MFDALQYLIQKHKDLDLKIIHETPGYTPTVGVIASRIASYYEDRLKTLIKAVRGDAWMESSPEHKGRAFYVDFRDNRNAGLCRVAAQEIAMRAVAAGYKARTTGSVAYPMLYITLPASIEVDAHRVYGAYLREIGKGLEAP